MTYFLDTDTCIYFLKGTFPALQKKILNFPPNIIKIPSMVAAELMYGAEKSQKAAKNTETVEKFLKPLQVISFDLDAAAFYGKIRASLEKKGNVIGFNDIIIAATVLANNGILVTSNIGEFSRIEGLAAENWTHD